MFNLKRQLPHYFVLGGIVLISIVGLILFSYDKLFQASIVISASVSFVVWGIVHHWLHENLHIKLVLEYVTVAALGSMILLSLIS